jgi:hypothetical protein
MMERKHTIVLGSIFDKFAAGVGFEDFGRAPPNPKSHDVMVSV